MNDIMGAMAEGQLARAAKAVAFVVVFAYSHLGRHGRQLPNKRSEVE